MQERVYLDHNATTPLRPEVRARWLQVQEELAGNPSSLHAAGRRARDLVDAAREQVAAALGAHEDEIVFVSGGTEANNLALAGAVRALASQGKADGIVSSTIEHSAVLETARALEREGHALTLLSVDANAMPDWKQLEEELKSHRYGLVSIMAANNEVGSVPPLSEVDRRLSGLEPRPLFHTDAVQALGRVPVELSRWGVDLAAFSAHKVGGPVGNGVLWRRKGVPLAPVIHGGGQEHSLRPGTEDVAGIVASALAIELAVAEQTDYARRTRELMVWMWSQVTNIVPAAGLLGPPVDSPERLPNTLSFSVSETEGKVLVTRFDLEGLEIGAGSACASGALEPSHVLLAMGLDEERARSGLRISLGRDTTRSDCTRALDVLRKVFCASRAT